MSLEVRTRLREYIIRRLLDGDSCGFTDETDLIGTRILDSFEMAQLVAFIEEDFSVQVPPELFLPEVFRNVTTIADVVDQSLERTTER